MVDLPIQDVLEELRAALRARGRAVLQAPPGAGKTTVVPLDLLASGLVQGRIVMLEPRRLAARAAAERMAETLGEAVGGTVGYRIRGAAKVSAATRIEVVTEGILTRMIQADASLPGVGLVIFDEFHERSLNADLGLALCLELAGLVREDLKLLVMSATLDAAPVAALMGDAPLVTSAGRAFPVETRWLGRPVDASMRLEAAVAGLLAEAYAAQEGGVLVFLPGEAEIRRVEALLAGRLPGAVVLPLFGAMEFQAQRAALGPVDGRRVVLATSIAETSLTLPDIRVVVDGGRARRARFDPASGMSRLVTERVTRAEAEQRRGRAGRVAPGVCYRLWTRGEEGGLAAHPPAEIEAADLAGLALELAVWGSEALPFLTPPPAGALAEARALLAGLGAVDGAGRITPHGRTLAGLPLHPRLAHLLVRAGGSAEAAEVAALLSDRDPLNGAPPDLTLRLEALRHPDDFARRHPWQVSQAGIARLREEARRLRRAVPARRPAGQGADPSDLSVAELAALAYPDRVGLRRQGAAPRWLLAGGKGAAMAPGASLAGARLIVATDLDGDPREAQVRQAVAISEAELRRVLGGAITRVDVCAWSRREGRVVARRQERLGALVLGEVPWEAPDEALAAAAFEGLRDLGLPWSARAARLRARILLAGGQDWPDCSDAGLLAQADWLLPWLGACRTASDLKALDLTEALQARLGRERLQKLEELVPEAFTTPLGRRIPIDYGHGVPEIAVRLQEMFGVSVHPVVGAQRQPVKVTLLSPRAAPIQVTMDLPGFWKGSYAEVRKDMRATYPRHPWPEDPTRAEPTLRPKPRGT